VKLGAVEQSHELAAKQRFVIYRANDVLLFCSSSIGTKN
jgi:hypothetical protein